MQIDPEIRKPEMSSMGSNHIAIIITIIATLCLTIIYLLGGFSKINQPSYSQGLIFERLFDKYKINPFPNDVYKINGLTDNLKKLLNEPCDQQAITEIANALATTSFKHEAVEVLIGFAGICPNPAGYLAYAGNIEFDLGAYEKALDLSNQSIHQSPSYNIALYLRARALQKLNRNDEALKSYAELISSYTIQSYLNLDVFTNMALTYASKGRYCEAASTLHTYIGFDPVKRNTDSLEREISNYELLGGCGSSFAGGGSETLKLGNGVIVARIKINDVPGNFIVDTGATFVAVSPEFASKAKLAKNDAYTIVSITANGEAKSTLTVINNVRLGHLSARNVPALITDKVLGHGIDGLLGLSFLSRFEIKSHDKMMTITSTDSEGRSTKASKNESLTNEKNASNKHRGRHAK